MRSQKSVDTNPLAALAGLTCRASPANSSIAGAAALDSVRLRRNCSLLLCETQSGSLTCARGADRACAREKTGVLWKFLSRRRPRLIPERRQSRYKKTVLKAHARSKLLLIILYVKSTTTSFLCIKSLDRGSPFTSVFQTG